MSQELLYTSAPRGLKPGSRGFCTVLSTQGMAAPLTTALEGLSGYRPVYPTGDDRADRNPVVYSHLKLQSSGRVVNVLSRIADFGLDYSQRANKLAHHVVLDRTELLPGGPANLLSMRDFMRDEWSGEPTVIALKPVKRETDPPSGVCRTWQELTGDAGWAGVLAESFLQAPDRLVVLLFAPGQDILPLFNEAISLLPVERRWDVTFSTYFTGLATGTTCTWRAIVQDSKDAHESLRFVNALRLDLTSRSLGRATGGPLVDAARSGARPHNTPARATSRTGPSDVVFAEAERVHVEFSSEDRTPASFRRTVASPQPLKQPQAQSAPPPQPPPDREPTYKLLPATTSSASQSRPPRSLADVIEAESQRPAAGLGMWLGLGALALSFAALLSVVFMRPARDDNDQGDLANDRSAPIKAQAQPAANPKVEPKASAPKDKPTEVASNTPSTVPPPVAPNPKPADPMPPPSATSHSEVPVTPPKPDTPVVPPAPTNTKIEPLVLTLPLSKETPLDLYSFKHVPGPNQPQPGMVLLKPDWLPYVDRSASRSHVEAYNAKRSIVEEIKNAGGEPPVVALFTEYVDPTSQMKYRLKSVLPDQVPWLGWYRIRVLSATPGSPPIQDIAFSRFPIGDDKVPVEQYFKKDLLTWKLPASALVESSVKAQPKPKLVLDRLILKIDGQTISLDGDHRAAQSTWTCSLDEFTHEALKSFPDNTGPTSNKLELKLELASGTEGPEIRLKLTDVPKFLKGIEKDLTGSLIVAKSDINRQFKTIYDKPKGAIENVVTGENSKQDPKVAAIEELLKKCTADRPDGAAKIRQSLQDAIEDAQGQLRSEDDKGRKKDLKVAVEKLPKLIPLYESIEKYKPLEELLKKASVTSVRLYYELTGTLRDTEGKKIENGEIHEFVDVVNFGDSGTGDPKSNFKMQLKAGKNEGDAKP